MRRGIGVGHVQLKNKTKQQMAEFGAQIEAERISDVHDRLEALEAKIKALASKHRSTIQKDPLVRARFRQLADSLGVDLISSQSNVWAKTLGLGDFHYSLAVKVIEICSVEQKFTGGFVPIGAVLRQLKKQDPESDVSQGDILAALDRLKVLESGFSVVDLPDGTRAIQTTASGSAFRDVLRLKQFVAMTTAEEHLAHQFFSIDDAVSGLGWPKYRVDSVVRILLRDGSLWMDTHPHTRETTYWFL